MMTSGLGSGHCDEDEEKKEKEKEADTLSSWKSQEARWEGGCAYPSQLCRA